MGARDVVWEDQPDEEEIAAARVKAGMALERDAVMAAELDRCFDDIGSRIVPDLGGAFGQGDREREYPDLTGEGFETVIYPPDGYVPDMPGMIRGPEPAERVKGMLDQYGQREDAGRQAPNASSMDFFGD